MKTGFFILTGCFLFLCSSSYAQVKESNSDVQKKSTPPSVTKGYYSIGENGEKLNKPSSSAIEITSAESAPVVKKGYYAIGDNNRKLPKQLIIKKAGKSSKPTAKKGYYALDNNNEKHKE